jgi:hypothetical protein
MSTSNTPFWIDDMSVLFNKNFIYDIFPKPIMNNNEKLNAITRLSIYLSILGYFFTSNNRIIISGILTISSIVILYKVQANKLARQDNNNNINIKEAFTNPEIYERVKSNFTEPTNNNPLMNVLLTDYCDNPTRKPAAPSYNGAVEDIINEKTKMIDDKFAGVENMDNSESINDRLYKDLGDAIEFENSMRTFHTTANTAIPNDQEAFAKFCFGDMPSCKEGNIFACTRNMPPRYTQGG